MDSSGVFHGFVCTSPSSCTTLDSTGTTFTVADGINNAGQVIGYYADSANYYHTFVYTPAVGGGAGSYALVDPPGASGSFTLANGINNSGQVVREFTDAVGATHAFIATPKP